MDRLKYACKIKYYIDSWKLIPEKFLYYASVSLSYPMLWNMVNKNGLVLSGIKIKNSHDE